MLVLVSSGTAMTMDDRSVDRVKRIDLERCIAVKPLGSRHGSYYVTPVQIL